MNWNDNTNLQPHFLNHKVFKQKVSVALKHRNRDFDIEIHELAKKKILTE